MGGALPIFFCADFMMAHIERWKHEVGTLQENSQAERKFLVKKLRDMHVSSQFVQHSIRPRLAVFEARQAASGELSLSTSLPAIRRA